LAGRKLAESGKPGFPPEKPLAEVLVSEIPRYKDTFLLEDRGAFVLHMLRKLVGDENFCLIIRSYMAAFTGQPKSTVGESPGPSSIRGENLESSSTVGAVSSGAAPGVEVNHAVPKRARLEDFAQIAEAASGQRLDWFFSEWLYGNVLPDYRIADMKVSVSRDTTFVDVKVENMGTGLMPVPVALFTDKGQRTSEVWLAAHESAQMRFITRSKPKRVEIDPQKWIPQADISNDGLDVSLPGTGKK
jgi:aminopeptidase N